MTPVIRFENVTRSYGDPANPDAQVVALDKVSFTINKGEFVAVTGPSGSGKSTLLHLVGLLDKPSSGKILVDGIDTSKMSDNKLARLRNQKIGFVFQQFNLLAKTAAIVNVELPLVYSGVAKLQRLQRAKEELEAVGLGDRLQNKPSQLSGGQQQRVAIARALVTGPSLLLADEPTGNLDSKTGTEILSLFDELHKKGVTIIMVTHDPNIARHANRQIIVKDGRIVS
ncbi:MAG: ABC transporter related protein [Candidatus Amesbacteria bacterium GW2011_GWA2_42_12]|uniref:ABC transporter related protein n=1 Tax=Candidatus Amesbacteria bacterium GW2011_GWA2_42_12 TaxID=1618356 RepID=A0A0G1AG91_9BACT|nr:MAG: ABC transporter related protein [Candidatus Amesbacteria bacterium GW2011_GWA2_42_12]